MALGTWVFKEDSDHGMEPSIRDSSATSSRLLMSNYMGPDTFCRLIWHYMETPVFNTLKRCKFFNSKEIIDQTPESFVAIFLFQTCIFVNLHFPNSASELEVTA